MSEFWKAKIWGLLHDPALKALYTGSGRGEEGAWEELDCMQGWVSPKDRSRSASPLSDQWLRQVGLCDLIASASDRAAIGRLQRSVNYEDQGLNITHLLSGALLRQWKLPPTHHQELIQRQGQDRAEYLQQRERELLESIKGETDFRTVFWWLWRCLPEAACQSFENNALILMPAETRIPDGSIWSYASLTAALAGAIAGYETEKDTSHPYLVTFSFSPIQELIKASRKMRDFSSGSWILHYLSARVCWKLANLYGPDSFLYPSLYSQPLIDFWLLQQWPQWRNQGKNTGWIKQPTPRQLLTAGFPNVLVLVLPKKEVKAAMHTAEKTLKEEWQNLGTEVFQELHKRRWMSKLESTSRTWQRWLKAQWQTYWAALPIGKENETLEDTRILENSDRDNDSDAWVKMQNDAYDLQEKSRLFLAAEIDFMRETFDPEASGVNIGSWWPSIFDQTRLTLATVKNARNWQIPTAFGPRSTVSGLGPVVHPDKDKNKDQDKDKEKDWITEGETRSLWKRHAGLFDGIEQLNATETVKRGLQQVLPNIIRLTEAQINATYPDLTGGLAGYLKVSDRTCLPHFHRLCQAVKNTFLEQERVILDVPQPWGIPWIDEHPDTQLQQYHPRFLNASWLVEDLETREQLALQKQIDRETNPEIIEQLSQQLSERTIQYRQAIQQVIDQFYPQNNPADWYLLAAGDGDGMSEWLKGVKMTPYYDYIDPSLQEYARQQPDNQTPEAQKFKHFVENVTKRMGPATHSALSRALLDFSNQLVPYLTEERYAGRLIYGGGDDVLAYTNLWEWDSWLWDIRQCFKGANDPKGEFTNEGDYWRWEGGELPKNLSERPLFTMGSQATISFGITIAHHSVPMAIALENLWDAENGAKKHKSADNGKKDKDAVQVRVLYGNGNILKATAKFDVFNQWRELLNIGGLESAIFEQAAEIWGQHPAPVVGAIPPWTVAFCSRREAFKNDEQKQQQFQEKLQAFIAGLYETTETKKQLAEIQNWLKLAAFVLRNRDIKIGGNS